MEKTRINRRLDQDGGSKSTWIEVIQEGNQHDMRTKIPGERSVDLIPTGVDGPQEKAWEMMGLDILGSFKNEIMNSATEVWSLQACKNQSETVLHSSEH